jgi:hypothetical protein
MSCGVGFDLTLSDIFILTRRRSRLITPMMIMIIFYKYKEEYILKICNI